MMMKAIFKRFCLKSNTNRDISLIKQIEEYKVIINQKDEDIRRLNYRIKILLKEIEKSETAAVKDKK
jgi:hypothetical protein